MESELPWPQLHLAATTVQRFFRGFRVRHAIARKKQVRLDAASAHSRSLVTWQLVDNAVRCIQNGWRSSRNRRIYRYYRDLIQFRERGDPRELLRSINPREATLADAASGIHVRFRLGGATFPPLIFYKILTHRPVTDINAFGPRDYANEIRASAGDVNNKPISTAPDFYSGYKQQPSAENSPVPKSRIAPQGKLNGLHSTTNSTASSSSGMDQIPARVAQQPQDEFSLDKSLIEFIKPDGSIGLRSTNGWYERYENNGWRPIGDRILVDEDPVTTMTRLKRVPMFHHDPVQRRQDKARVAALRKHQWMMRMYQASDGEPARISLEDEINPEDLLAWSAHLDYDSYVDAWTSLACSLGSEAYTMDDTSYLIALPPTMIDIPAAMQAVGAPLLPHKGGTAGVGVTSSMFLPGY